MEVDVTGVSTLRLAIAGDPGIAGAWGIWGGAVLSKSGDVSGISFYRELVIENPVPETDPAEETTEAPSEPITEAPTEVPTEPVTETPTETLPDTEAVTDTSAETSVPTETGGASGGCKATLAGTGILLTGVAALALTKRKEDESQ